MTAETETVNFHWIAAGTHPKTKTHPKTTNSIQQSNQEVNKPGPAIAEPNCSHNQPGPRTSNNHHAQSPTSLAQAPLKTWEQNNPTTRGSNKSGAWN